MANDYKKSLLTQIEGRLGPLVRIPGSQSLFDLASGVRVYLRYSKIHGSGNAFYGLRQVDLNLLDGHDSFICFFSDKQQPLFVPYADFDSVIRQSSLASDGQYKVQLTFESGTRNLYLPRVGHFNVDAYGGLDALYVSASGSRDRLSQNLTHSQAQTLIGSIGSLKGYGVYVPPNNADLLDWNIAPSFHLVKTLPAYIEERTRFASEIDVIWIDHTHNLVSAAFEVEHSTPVYSGLLRFNDVLLTCPGSRRFFVVSNEARRDLFARQLQRPTFQRSGLSDMASFLDYTNVYDWHCRLVAAKDQK